MNKRLYRIVGLLTALSLSRAHAVIITPAGVDTTTGADWRTTTTTKPLDGDHNNVYGSLGYYVIATDFVSPTVGSIFSLADPSSGPFVISQQPGLDDPRYQPGPYGSIDDPSLTPGPSVADMNLGFGFHQGSIVGTTYTMIDVTLGAGVPADFRLGIMNAGVSVAALGDSASFTVAYPAGGLSATEALGSGPYHWTFFDISGASAGQVFTIGVSQSASDTAGYLGFGALSFDAIVPEPSSLLLLALGGGIVWRRLRRG